MSEYTFFGIRLIKINPMSVDYGITLRYIFDFPRNNFLGYAMAPSLKISVPIKTSRSVSASRTTGYSHLKRKSSMTILNGRKLPSRPTVSGSLINMTLDAKEDRSTQEAVSQ